MKPVYATLLLGALVFAATESQAGICSLLFGQKNAPSAQVATAVPHASGVRTSARRDAQLDRMQAWQISMIDGQMLGKSETPPMYFYAEEGVSSQLLVQSGGLNGVISELKVNGLKEGDILNGTILLPVSGHDGFASAQKWSVEDKFDVLMQVGEGPNGDQFPSTTSPKPTVLVNQMPSTGLVTRVDLAIPVPPAGKQVRLLYYRLGVAVGQSTGMGAPEGYSEGRLFKINFVP